MYVYASTYTAIEAAINSMDMHVTCMYVIYAKILEGGKSMIMCMYADTEAAISSMDIHQGRGMNTSTGSQK